MRSAAPDVHDQMERNVARVPFADATIRVLSPSDLILCKAVFDRPKDWVDIEAVLDAGTEFDRDGCLGATERIVGINDQRIFRLRTLFAEH